MAADPPLSSASFIYDRQALKPLLPHTGRMCLLAGVCAFDQDSITCLGTDHQNPDHPLRARGRLGAICGVEYAAQAMAVHAALRSPAQMDSVPAGALVAVRDIRFLVDRLDTLTDDMVVICKRRAGDCAAALYDFRLTAGRKLLLSGRATVSLAPLSAPVTMPPEPLS